MVTIKDIARRAGVAQGTVSNVLSGKENVSSEKMKRVIDAAKQLGYVPNERASLLRKGLSDSLAVIMPNTRAKHYDEFYFSFKQYSEEQGYKVTRYLTNENTPASEEEACAEVLALQVKGLACILNRGTGGKAPAAITNTVYVERRPGCPGSFLGFDYLAAGTAMAEQAQQHGYTRVCLLTGNLKFSNEQDFYNGFIAAIDAASCEVLHIQTDQYRKNQNIMQMLSGPSPQAFFISNYGFAESVKDITATFCRDDAPARIYTVSSQFTMPEKDFIKYEMNYAQLGKIAAETLIRRAGGIKEETHSQYLESDGFRNWSANIIVPNQTITLNVVTLDSPEAYIMRNFSRLFTQKSGIAVNLCILSYDEIYEAYNTMDESSGFDILRLDVMWLSWFAGKLLRPLRTIDPNIEQHLDHYLDGTPEHYAKVHGEIYALPSTPSVQILYYRKDLLESPIYKRMYYEMYGEELAPPKTFAEFNHIAAFFTKSVNPSSPVPYGATVTLGSTGVAGSEFLARLFSHQENLYDRNREIHLDSALGIQSLKELVELKKYTDLSPCGWWTNTAKSFAAGSYAMAILYSNFASDFLGYTSNVVGNIGYSMMPGNNPVIGGGSLGVARYSKHPEAALSFIKWMCSEPVASAAAFLGSTSPRRKTYENYEIVSSFPWMNLLKDCFSLTHGRRLPDDIRKPFDERKFLSILSMAIKNSYNGICLPEEALKNAQIQFEKNFDHRF